MRKRLKKKKGMLKIKKISSDHAHDEAQVKRLILFYAEAVIDSDPDWLMICTIADAERTPILRQYEVWRRKYGRKNVNFETGWCEGIKMKAQLVYLFLGAMELGASAVKHGEPKGNYSFWTSSASLIITLLLLWWGGFFDCFFK
ncbi:MAG: hypothetical protein WC373_12150 [Smithella sp.]|jgi:hypothetical protein